MVQNLITFVLIYLKFYIIPLELKKKSILILKIFKMKRILVLILFSAFTFSAFAQMPQILPLDPKVKSGKLENGLTYFVMKNDEPKGQADFYIVQKVGAILEEENQRGLAHFLEHMAFNGSKNFPGNGIISYLEKIGVKFGENLNAYTAIDETVYNISNVPVKRQGIIDSCLLILHDWSCAISLNDEDIDKERGVIREELRTRSNAQMRMLEKMLPEIMPESKYAYRLPGGLVEVIEKFTYKELRDYYAKWYRPDLQGIVVVGDIDPDAVENQIKSLFGSVPKKVNPAERVEFPVPDTKAPVISVGSDSEATGTTVMLMFKQNVFPKELRPTVASLVNGYMNSLVVSMLNSRLREITEKADAPFTGARASYGNVITAKTKDCFEIDAMAKDGELNRALRAIVNESERVRKFGFTASEYERAKANYSTMLEKFYAEKENQKNNFYIKQLVNSFISGEVYSGIEVEYAIMKQVIDALPLEQINTYVMSLPKEENVAIAIMMPEKEGLTVPSKEEVLNVYTSALNDDVEAYKETVSNEPLVPVIPAPGKVIREMTEPITGATVWTLSNGATVVLKKTDFKEDEVIMTASSRGGYSQISPDEIVNIKVIGNLISLGGVSKFSSTDLRKLLAGKRLSLGMSISPNTESISGNTSPKDIETFMQLLYLNMTSLRQDDEVYKSFISRLKTSLKNQEADPMQAFQDTLQVALYNNNIYTKRLTLDMVDKIDYARTLELAKERFANAADFTFIFVGNIDPAVLKPLAETYIGSLPANKTEKEEWKELPLIPVKGKIVNHFDKTMKTPKTTVYTVLSGKMPYNLENAIMTSMTKQVFDLIFTKTIREEESGTYGVGVKASIGYYPEDYFTFLFGFDTNGEMKDKLLAIAHKEIANVIENGVDPVDFNKIVEYMMKSHTENLRENGYWAGVLQTRFLLGKDNYTTYESTLKSITPEKLQNFIKEALTQGNQVEVIMNGKQ